jgi:hypothetical protein
MAPKKAIKAMKATTPVKKSEMAKFTTKATTPVKKATTPVKKATTPVKKAMKAETPVKKATTPVKKAKIAMKATQAKAGAKSRAKVVVWKKVWPKSYDGKYRSWVLLKLEQDRGAVVEHWQGTLH